MTDQPDWVFDNQIRQWVRKDVEPAPRPRRLSEPEYAMPISLPRGFVDYRHADAVPASAVRGFSNPSMFALSRKGELIDMNPDPIQIHRNDLLQQMMHEVDGEIISAAEAYLRDSVDSDLNLLPAESHKIGRKERRFRRRLAARRQ